MKLAVRRWSALSSAAPWHRQAIEGLRDCRKQPVSSPEKACYESHVRNARGAACPRRLSNGKAQRPELSDLQPDVDKPVPKGADKSLREPGHRPRHDYTELLWNRAAATAGYCRTKPAWRGGRGQPADHSRYSDGRTASDHWASRALWQRL